MQEVGVLLSDGVFGLGRTRTLLLGSMVAEGMYWLVRVAGSGKRGGGWGVID